MSLKRSFASTLLERRLVTDGDEIGIVRSGDWYYMSFHFLFAECGAARLRMVSLPYLNAQLDKLKMQARFTEVFELGVFTKEEIAENRRKAEEAKKKGGAQKSGPSPVKAEDLRSISDRILEKKPVARTGQFKGGEQVASVYGMPSLSKLSRLQEYLEINGGFQLKYVPKDGTCMWQAVLTCISSPGEYQFQMLQRQVVLTISEHPDFFLKLLRDHIKAQYGPPRLPTDEFKKKLAEGALTAEQKEDQVCPGPFSLVTYLEYLLKKGTWGDYGVLLVISMMWQVKVTVILGESLHQERIRHNSGMRYGDLVLVFCGGNRYVPAGEERRSDEIGPPWSRDSFMVEPRLILTILPVRGPVTAPGLVRKSLSPR